MNNSAHRSDKLDEMDHFPEIYNLPNSHKKKWTI